MLLICQFFTQNSYHHSTTKCLKQTNNMRTDIRFFICIKAVLKLNTDFCTLLIGVEGAKLLENAFAFSSCGVFSRMLIQCPAGVRIKGRPAGARRRGGSLTARGSLSAWSGNQQANLTKPLLIKYCSGNMAKKAGECRRIVNQTFDLTALKAEIRRPGKLPKSNQMKNLSTESADRFRIIIVHLAWFLVPFFERTRSRRSVKAHLPQ